MANGLTENTFAEPNSEDRAAVDLAERNPTFRSMDESTEQQWREIGRQTRDNQSRTPIAILEMLRSLVSVVDGFAIDQLGHSLQTATRAERAGADEEMVVASLCHDIGKAISVANHPRIAAEILRPYVSDEVYKVILTHQDFQGRHYYRYFGLNPESRSQYIAEPWFELGEKFADEWDQTSFDPDYSTESLEHFEPMVMRVFAKPKAMI